MVVTEEKKGDLTIIKSGLAVKNPVEKDDLVDRHASLIVRGAVIGTGLLGLAVFTRSIRLFSQFQHGREIPREFMQKHLKLRGMVEGITDSGELRVRHLPMANLPSLFRKKEETGRLTVRVAGVQLTPKAKDWLEENVRNRQITFSLIDRVEPNTLDSEIFVKQSFFRRPDVNRQLVRLGLATIRSLEDEGHLKALQENSEYSRLVSRLIISEKWADRRGVGIWQRQSFLESLYSLPTQAKDLCLNSSVYQFLTLSTSAIIRGAKVGYAGTKTAIAVTSDVGKKAIGGTKTAMAVTANAYGKSKQIAMKIASLMAQLRQKLSSKN